MSREPIEWTFLAPGCPRATGGDIARFELVNALARRGDHVEVVHLPHVEMRIRDLTDLPWFVFDPAVHHVFAADLDVDAVPDADVVVYSTKLLATALAPEVSDSGRRLVDALQTDRDRRWLPILFLQGYGVFPSVLEDLALRLPGPKVCVGAWLAELVLQRGASASEVVHIPNGIDPGTFGITRPIGARVPHVAMNFDPYPAKRGRVGIDAVERLHRRSDVRGTIFGTIPLERAIEPGLDFVLSPSQAQLADRVYNEASMFLQPSLQEGFGMCAVESMACGCALVTTDNGGSREYAFDGETALICGPEPEDMVEVLARLVADDALRVRIATAGARFVERFRWPASAEQLARLAASEMQTEASRSGEPIDLGVVLRELRTAASDQ